MSNTSISLSKMSENKNSHFLQKNIRGHIRFKPFWGDDFSINIFWWPVRFIIFDKKICRNLPFSRLKSINSVYRNWPKIVARSPDFFHLSGLNKRFFDVLVGPGCWAKKNESSIDNQFGKNSHSGTRSFLSILNLRTFMERPRTALVPGRSPELGRDGPDGWLWVEKGPSYRSRIEFVDKINDKLPNERLTIHRSPRWQKSYHRQLDQVQGSVTWFMTFEPL